MPAVDFWYEFASTYSYPAAMRVEALARERGVTLSWRPFLLGPIFAARGMADSPFNLNAAKGRYMWSDLTRVCARHGLPLRRPEPFPQNSLLAARVALALDDTRRPEFSRAVYTAEFGGGPPIAERATLAAILEGLGLNAADILERAVGAPVKDKLRSETARAESLGIFGAPNLVTADGEIFWGNDRLEEGIDWAVALTPARDEAPPRLPSP
ncbi:2-hydroxychromene-2-carboxylate isomerase [Methylocapsa sp. S129]|uniref:2-hydroxychromene-2-carboxylate isomerase n=1 Tax=Methylocapsa sp. S129 TaxID=1641869 RepID=UPI00131DE17C|nr:2-hydroxychromene-2-carboxylate isomerase [Methylocapsa sp. S129]